MQLRIFSCAFLMISQSNSWLSIVSLAAILVPMARECIT
nr:MAG TPA: hypothetical protein [Caudoviricetes sp.]